MAITWIAKNTTKHYEYESFVQCLVQREVCHQLVCSIEKYRIFMR